MALVNKIFCGLAAAGALFFVIAVVLTFSQIGQNPDGGKGMGIVSGGLRFLEDNLSNPPYSPVNRG